MKIKKFLSHSIVYTSYLSQTVILESFQQKLAAHSVHFLQALILTSLFFEDREVRPLELHQTFGIEKSNLSHSLRGLEKLGLLKRTMHPTDARGYCFTLTASGKKKALTLIKEFDVFQETIEAIMGVSKTNDVVKGMQTLIFNYSAKN
ncbi:MAG: MarR family transcriptional regulator [Bacteriovorax sp.]|nr:MarR family transcriptional regulator [Bacteriovorax sp.]